MGDVEAPNGFIEKEGDPAPVKYGYVKNHHCDDG
jgi:hypothetical protein